MMHFSIRSLTAAFALMPSGAVAQTLDKPSLSIAGAHDVIVVAKTVADTAGQASVPGEVSFFSADKVKAAFEKSMPLLETSGYKVLASAASAMAWPKSTRATPTSFMYFKVRPRS